MQMFYFNVALIKSNYIRRVFFFPILTKQSLGLSPSILLTTLLLLAISYSITEIGTETNIAPCPDLRSAMRQNCVSFVLKQIHRNKLILLILYANTPVFHAKWEIETLLKAMNFSLPSPRIWWPSRWSSSPILSIPVSETHVKASCLSSTFTGPLAVTSRWDWRGWYGLGEGWGRSVFFFFLCWRWVGCGTGRGFQLRQEAESVIFFFLKEEGWTSCQLQTGKWMCARERERESEENDSEEN